LKPVTQFRRNAGRCAACLSGRRRRRVRPVVRERVVHRPRAPVGGTEAGRVPRAAGCRSPADPRRQEGMGRSQRVAPEALPSIGDRVADLEAVLDAVGTDRVIVASASESGRSRSRSTAAHPERARGLALYACRARYGEPLPGVSVRLRRGRAPPLARPAPRRVGHPRVRAGVHDWMAPSLAADPMPSTGSCG
jgi:pimeloyl-ACP methyl ester carboxylesterase